VSSLDWTLLACVAALLAVLGWSLASRRRRAPRRLALPPGARRILVPFSGPLDRTVLNAAIRIARAEDAVLVPAYLLVVPLRYDEGTPLGDEVARALPLLEAVELAALRAGVPVDARIEKGRTLTHALRRLWDVERFDRIVAPANGREGFSEQQLAWLLTNAPAETLVLKPAPVESPAWSRSTSPLPTSSARGSSSTTQTRPRFSSASTRRERASRA
jgi:hypothetical protein